MGDLNGYSYYYAAELQTHGMGIATYTPVTSFYVGLSTSQPGPTPPTDWTELAPGVNNYQRALAPNTVWNAASGTDSKVDNNAEIQFNQSSGPWGTIFGFGVFDVDAPSTTNLLWGGALTTPKTIETDTIAVFLIGQISVSSDYTHP